MSVVWDDPTPMTPLKVKRVERARNVFEDMTGSLPSEVIAAAFDEWSQKRPLSGENEAFTAGVRFCEDYHMKKAQG